MDKAKMSKMVDRFLSWPLPKDFSPDGGIVFKNSPDARGYAPYQPIGTNLLTAEQARGMIEHILGGEYEELQADNLRLSNLVTKFDTALRTIATEAGMTEAYSGVDTEASLKNFVNAISKLCDCSKCELEKRNIEDLW